MATHQVQQENLFVAIDPRDEHHYALERAIITSRLRAPRPRVNVFVSCDDNIKAGSSPRHMIREQKWFDSVVREPLEALDIRYDVLVSWGGTWPEELIESARELGASMILTPLHDESRHYRSILSPSKWALLKHAHCPVLLVRPGASEKRKVIVAAVNFQAREERQKALNERILGHARRVANRYTADLHVVNAYLDNMHYPDRGILARESGLSAKRIHVRQGYTDEVVSAVVGELDADMVVMGTLNQRGSAGSIRRGNTAARLIAALDTDTLVVN